MIKIIPIMLMVVVMMSCNAQNHNSLKYKSDCELSKATFDKNYAHLYSQNRLDELFYEYQHNHRHVVKLDSFKHCADFYNHLNGRLIVGVTPYKDEIKSTNNNSSGYKKVTKTKIKTKETITN